MKRFMVNAVLFALVLSLAGAPVALGAVSANTELVSVSLTGTVGNGESRWNAISADGRYVAFDSACSNLVPGYRNGWWYSIYLHDRMTGVAERISVSSTGELADYDS